MKRIADCINVHKMTQIGKNFKFMVSSNEYLIKDVTSSIDNILRSLLLFYSKKKKQNVLLDT